MTLYFSKARELGELILRSDQAAALAEANLTGENTEAAKYGFDALVNQIINMVKATVYEDKEADFGCHCGGCGMKG
jgi:redox-regulated HSP33 family molecular chaperone